ncbi:MAG: asparagine synthase [Bacillota bacterium]|nr:asparagine synthase [Bacillota bacterium]
MHKGIIPVILGTAVTTTGLALGGIDVKKRGMNKRDRNIAISAGILGLGLAHVILGSIDLCKTEDNI